MRYLGIDIQKMQSHFHIQDESGKKIASGKFPTQPIGFAALVEKYADDEGLRVALETGNLTFPAARAMSEAGADVFVVDPYQNALIARSTKKTDRLDAKQLCNQRRLGMLPPIRVYVPSVQAEELRRLMSARARLIKERTALSNRAVRLADRNDYEVSRGSLSLKKAWKRFLSGAEAWSDLDRFLAGQYAEDFARLDRQIGELDRWIDERSKRDFEENAKRIQTVPGIGRLNAAALCAQVEEIDRFATAQQFCRYLGLTPTVRESGGTRHGGPIVKSGSGLIRGYLMQAILQVLRHTSPEDPLHAWYDNIRRRRGWKKARVALMRKLASIVFGVWKHGTVYDPSKVRAQSVV